MDLEGKNYMLMMDNGDGTCTSIVSIPEAGFEETSVIQMDFADLVEGAVGVALSVPEYTQDFIDRSTVIPNDTQGVEE